MYKFKFYCLIIMTVFLSSCAIKDRINKNLIFDPAQQMNKSQGTVILNVKREGLWPNDDFTHVDTYKVSKLGLLKNQIIKETEYAVKEGAPIIRGFDEEYEVITLPAGIYILSSFHFKRYDTKTTGRGAFVWFQVVPGAISYVGDIKMYKTNDDIEIVISNNFEEAKKYFAKKHPSVKHKIRESLGGNGKKLHDEYYKL